MALDFLIILCPRTGSLPSSLLSLGPKSPEASDYLIHTAFYGSEACAITSVQQTRIVSACYYDC